jgi:hypothetical protein
MKGWNDTELAIIWFLRKRIYSYSQRYILPDYSEKKPTIWTYWGSLINNGSNNINIELWYSNINRFIPK